MLYPLCRCSCAYVAHIFCMAVPSNNITGMSVNGHDVGCYRSNFKGSVSAAVQLWMTTPSTTVLHFACQHCMRRTACISICSVHYITFAVSLHFTHAHFTTWMWPHSDVLDVCVDNLHLPATAAFTLSSIRSLISYISFQRQPVGCCSCMRSISFECVYTTHVFWLCISLHCIQATHIHVA
jgi:hypothetical protein